MGKIPDKRGLAAPIGDEGIKAQAMLLRLIEQRWLKAKSMGHYIDEPNKISVLAVSQRHGISSNLNDVEADEIKMILLSMEKDLSFILFRHRQNRRDDNDFLTSLRAFLCRPEVNINNLKSSLKSQEMALLWAFIYGKSPNADVIRKACESLETMGLAFA